MLPRRYGHPHATPLKSCRACVLRLRRPHSKLMQLDITNWTRTKTKFELLKLLVDVGVSWWGWAAYA